MGDSRPNKSAVLLFSGGLDSCVALALSRAYSWDITCLGVDYGQSHATAELQAAARIADYYKSEFVQVRCDVAALAKTPLTGLPAAGPRTLSEMRQESPSPNLIPGRNSILLSMAMGLAEHRKIHNLSIGATLEDHGGFRDCRIEYFTAFEEMARLATGLPITVMHPLAQMRKSDVIKVGISLDAPLASTVSCYHPIQGFSVPKPCGRCEACILRQESFESLGIDDPAGGKPVRGAFGGV